jgi:hypothetical protein
VRRELRAARIELEQEAIQVVRLRVGDQAAALEQARRREPARLAGLLQRLGLGLVAVRGIEQFVAQ